MTEARARGKGFRPYGVFLRSLLDELETAVAELENLEFHHAPLGSAEFQHYLRVWTWCDEVTARMERFGNTKKQKAWQQLNAARPEARHPLADPTDQQHLGGGDPDRDRPRRLDGGH